MKTWKKALAATAISMVVAGLPAMAANAASPIVPYGAIGAEWNAKGGASGFLGQPLDNESDVAGVPGARTEDFAGGSIYWSLPTGAHEIHGYILAEYVGAAGGPTVYGLPLTDETTTPDGVGRFNHFSAGGSIYWTPWTGAHNVYGAIRGAWAAAGWERGVLGYPSSDEYITGVPGTRMEYFVGGQMYWSPATGAHEVHGAILDKYLSAGGVESYGLPLTDETTTPDGVGRFNHFSNGGSIYWTPASGAHVIYGAIKASWAAVGWERGPVGYPTQDEIDAPGVSGAREQDFTAGQEYWSPSTGAHEVHGAILAEYIAIGGAPAFGLPLTDEVTAPDRVGRFSHFQGGSIYWTPATGAHEVHGAIKAAWAGTGWERGPLGYPTTDETDIGGGRQSSFQHGYINWVNYEITVHVS